MVYVYFELEICYYKVAWLYCFIKNKSLKVGNQMVNYNGKHYVCLLDFAMEFIRGKWKAVLLCHLYDEPRRFLELQRITNGISQKVIFEQNNDALPF